MNEQTTVETWYVGKTGNHQGLVISEADGRNIAVTYDAKDAPLVASAPHLLECCRVALAYLERDADDEQEREDYRTITQSIYQATGESEGRK